MSTILTQGGRWIIKNKIKNVLTKCVECSEGEFLVKKIMSWEGVRKEFVEAICNFAVNLIPNSLLTLNFGTKNSPSGLFGIWKNIFQTSTVFDLS